MSTSLTQGLSTSPDGLQCVSHFPTRSRPLSRGPTHGSRETRLAPPPPPLPLDLHRDPLVSLLLTRSRPPSKSRPQHPSLVDGCGQGQRPNIQEVLKDYKMNTGSRDEPSSKRSYPKVHNSRDSSLPATPLFVRRLRPQRPVGSGSWWNSLSTGSRHEGHLGRDTRGTRVPPKIITESRVPVTRTLVSSFPTVGRS